jgi:hypothetical protein
MVRIFKRKKNNLIANLHDLFQALSMENKVLSSVGYHISVPTVKTFLRLFRASIVYLLYFNSWSSIFHAPDLLWTFLMLNLLFQEIS